MRLKESISADKYLEINKEFWQDLERHCVAECCRIDAFDFSIEEIGRTIQFYDKEEIIKSLDILLDEIELSGFKYVSSTIFNTCTKKKVFIENLKRIKKNII